MRGPRMRGGLILDLVLALGVAEFSAAQAPALGPELPVNTFTTSHQSYPSVASSGSGHFIVTWQSADQDGSGQAVVARLFDSDGTPLTGELLANVYTTGAQTAPSVACDADGDFVVIWGSPGQDGSGGGIFGQRFDSAGTGLGEFPVNTFTVSQQEAPDVSMSPSGDFVVVWQSFSADGSGFGISARLFDANGVAGGAEFQVNTYTTGNQVRPRVAKAPSGDFVVAWESPGQDGDAEGIVARRFDASGLALTSEIPVNVYTTGAQTRPSVAGDASGEFLVAWQSADQDGDGAGVFARRFHSDGSPAGLEIQVNAYTTGAQTVPRAAIDSNGIATITWDSVNQDGSGLGVNVRRYDPLDRPVSPEILLNTYTNSNQTDSDVSVDPSGQFLVAWQSLTQDGSGFGIFARRGGFPSGQSMVVDAHAATGTSSNLNGVLEAGETVQVEPVWENASGAPLALDGSAANFTGAPGPIYTLDDFTADYGTIAAGESSNCLDATGDCLVVAVAGTRPLPHWDAVFDEELSSGVTKTWTLHMGGSFPDVSTSDPFYKYIENLFHNRITGGCGGENYCPGASVTRAQMAVFLLKSSHGSTFVPPPCASLFDDVLCPSLFADWIEQLSAEGITGGCGGGNYCPDNPVTRAQMAVFLLKSEHGSGYVPPACAGLFADVICPSLFADWIEQLAAESITGGCGGGNYCPDNPNTRGQMAVFLVKTFGLLLYGP